MLRIKAITIFATLILFSLNLNAQSYQGKYCELDGATTDGGKDVTGECYMYSDKYGELEGAETEDGEPVTGECYFYNL